MTHLERSCHSKKRYPAEISAKIVAQTRMAAGAPKLRVYACERCGGYHLTKLPEGVTREPIPA